MREVERQALRAPSGLPRAESVATLVSGGLLLAVPPEACESLVSDLRDGGDVHSAVIGEILSGGPPIVVS